MSGTLMLETADCATCTFLSVFDRCLAMKLYPESLKPGFVDPDCPLLAGTITVKLTRRVKPTLPRPFDPTEQAP